MFYAVYLFEVHPGKEEAFIASWHALTSLIYQYEGSLGSRLHRSDNGYIAYAGWPDRKTWNEAGSHLPEIASEWRQKMRECCMKVTTLHELEVVDDLLREAPFEE